MAERYEAIPGIAGDVHAPTAATAAVVTYAAKDGVAHCLSQINCSLAPAPAAAVNLKVEDDTTVIFSVDLPPAATVYTIPFRHPKKGTAGKKMVITLASGGGSVVGKLSCSHYTEGA